MATVTRTTTFADGNVLTASQLNGEFNNLLNALAIVNADIASGAAIAANKISGTAAVLSGNTFTGLNTMKSTAQTLTADSDGATITFDLSASNVHSVTLAGNRTLALSNPTTGQAFVIRLLQDATGSRTVTWFSTIKWSGGSAPTLSTGASKLDVFGFLVTSSGNYDGYIISQNMS